MITVPMEQDLLAGVAWIDTITSESVPGLSSVLLLFEPGTDLYRARQMVSERLSQAAVGLPHVSKPPTMIQPQSSTSRFMIVGLSSQDVPLMEMSVLARWVIGPRLLGVPGVANVAIWGNRDRQLQVQVDPERLRAQGVSLQQIIETTGNALWVSSLTYLEASTPGTGGFIDTPNQRIGIWHILPISSPEELAEVPVEGTTGLRLADVASVVEDHQPLIGDGLGNDGSSLMLVVEKLPGINTLEVTKGVEEALGALQPGMSGIEFDTSLFRPASFIEMAVDNLTNSLLARCTRVCSSFAPSLGLADRADQPLAILVSLMAALFVLYLRGRRSTSWYWPGWRSPSAPSSTMPSLTWKTSLAPSPASRAGRRQAGGSIILERLEMRGACSCDANPITVSAALLPGRRFGAFSSRSWFLCAGSGGILAWQ
jgi:multidrug efflux pump subunit AcrB